MLLYSLMAPLLRYCNFHCALHRSRLGSHLLPCAGLASKDSP